MTQIYTADNGDKGFKASEIAKWVGMNDVTVMLSNVELTDDDKAIVTVERDGKTVKGFYLTALGFLKVVDSLTLMPMDKKETLVEALISKGMITEYTLKADAVKEITVIETPVVCMDKFELGKMLADHKEVMLSQGAKVFDFYIWASTTHNITKSAVAKYVKVANTFYGDNDFSTTAIGVLANLAAKPVDFIDSVRELAVKSQLTMKVLDGLLISSGLKKPKDIDVKMQVVVDDNIELQSQVDTLEAIVNELHTKNESNTIVIDLQQENTELKETITELEAKVAKLIDEAKGYVNVCEYSDDTPKEHSNVFEGVFDNKEREFGERIFGEKDEIDYISDNDTTVSPVKAVVTTENIEVIGAMKWAFEKHAQFAEAHEGGFQIPTAAIDLSVRYTSNIYINDVLVGTNVFNVSDLLFELTFFCSALNKDILTADGREKYLQTTIYKYCQLKELDSIKYQEDNGLSDDAVYELENGGDYSEGKAIIESILDGFINSSWFSDYICNKLEEEQKAKDYEEASNRAKREGFRSMFEESVTGCTTDEEEFLLSINKAVSIALHPDKPQGDADKMVKWNSMISKIKKSR